MSKQEFSDSDPDFDESPRCIECTYPEFVYISRNGSDICVHYKLQDAQWYAESNWHFECDIWHVEKVRMPYDPRKSSTYITWTKRGIYKSWTREIHKYDGFDEHNDGGPVESIENNNN